MRFLIALALAMSLGGAAQAFTLFETEPNDCACEATPGGTKAVRYALSAIKGVGKDAMSRLAEERLENGPFEDLFDFAERLDQRVANKRLIEGLVKAGAFDSLNQNRAQTFGAVA